MKKILLCVFGILLLAPAVLTGINIAQNGSATPDGRSPREILGVAPNDAGPQDVARLSKADVMQLFYALAPPEPRELNGEYDAVLLDVGVLSAGSAWYTHKLFGDGRWSGKGFRAPRGQATDQTRGSGYSLFVGSENQATTAGKSTHEIRRLRKFDTNTGPSRIADGESFHLDYHAYNDGTVHSMRDEIRKINDRLHLGMGHMLLGGGPINPAPFLLLGPAKRGAIEHIDGLDPRD